MAWPVADVERYLMAVDVTLPLNPKLVATLEMTSPGRAGSEGGGCAGELVRPGRGR